MTTLVEELEQAADVAYRLKDYSSAQRLHARAAWVRELEAELRHSVDVGNAFAGICLVQTQRLTGPIPSAPPKETTT